MNGSLVDNSFIDRKPIITCSGELEVFSAIEDDLSTSLPKESCEWRRSMGRPIRSVHIGANFAPFNVVALPKGTQWDLIRQPLFHIYWTECFDVDAYKLNVRDDIETWLKEMNNRDIHDWLIVVVENYDGRRANKLLPRTTVLDKIRTDFATKQGDRCISVINPGKPESRSADSWRGLVTRIRHLLLVAYAKAVSRLEDYVRLQREKRNESGWNFMKYFQLQEELAQVLEMLGLYDEALIQYDELDALFSQFVLTGGQTLVSVTSNLDNSLRYPLDGVGDTDGGSWLVEFQAPLQRWRGLRLGPAVLSSKPSLLELRGYLFVKQAHMLLLTNKIWEIASRCLPFLHTCYRELHLLEITAPAGGISSWMFLAVMEVLRECEQYNQAEQVEAYSLHTASLWAYASEKLRDLGELCGLMPGGCPSSEQLHTVVFLSAGMGDNPGSVNAPSPTDKLKEALCSQDAFNRRYLELSELAMCTYKHIGRLRSARLIGRHVASFYLLQQETQKAAAFLTDALRAFEEDGWRELAAQTHVELAECHKTAGDRRKYIRSCIAVSAAPEIDNLLRWSYFDEMKKWLEHLEKPLIVQFKDVQRIVAVYTRSTLPVMQDTLLEVDVVLESNFPREVIIQDVLLAVEADAKSTKKDRRNGSSCKESKAISVSMQRLKVQCHLDYQQDRQLSSASVVSKTITLKRVDSTIAPPHSDFTNSLTPETLPLVLTPGMNNIRLTRVMSDVGKYNLGQMALHIGSASDSSRLLKLVSLPLMPYVTVEVIREEPQVRLDKGDDALLSGIEQLMHLTITIGSYAIEPKSVIKITTSQGVKLHNEPNEPLVNTLLIILEDTSPFACTRIPLRVYGDMSCKEHEVRISCPWSAKPVSVMLGFTSPLSTTWRLHTAKHRKFIQITIFGQCDRGLSVKEPILNAGSHIKVENYNSASSQTIGIGLSMSFTFELILLQTTEDTRNVKGHFSLLYALKSNTDELQQIFRTFNHYFDISDFQTLYNVEASVQPATKGMEFCRVGAVCHLHLCITPTSSVNVIVPSSSDGHHRPLQQSLMYEVVAEPSIDTLWAVCGRTAGVVTFDSTVTSGELSPQTIVIDVMPLTSGYLPLPSVRLSKYIPADFGVAERSGNKGDIHPRLEPFGPGQIYNTSKGQQVHVIATTNDSQSTSATF